MPPVDDQPVEFLVSGPDEGTDEDLAQPEGFPRLRRARLPLLAAGAVGLVVVIVVAALNGPSGSPSAHPAPTVTVSAPPSSATPRSPPPPPSLTFPGAHCPSDGSCNVLLSTPTPVRDAVRDALPRATQLLAATTITHRGAPGSQLLARAITGRVGQARLRIRVVPSAAHVRPTWNSSENAARTLVTAADRVHGYLVTVRVTAAPGHDIATPAVRHLAADPRLTRLS